MLRRVVIAIAVTLLATACGPDEGPDLSRFASVLPAGGQVADQLQ